MGSSLEEGVENGGCNKKSQKKLNRCMILAFMSLFLVAIIGSFILGWWIYKYHPTNSELWMVPFGLILLITPVIVSLSLIISGPSLSQKEEEDEEKVNDLKR